MARMKSLLLLVPSSLVIRSNFNYAGMLTEAILLGNVGMKMAGKKLEWDGPGFKFTNDSAAEQHLHFEYRKGYSL